MRYIIIAFTFLGTVFSFSIAFGKTLLPVYTMRGVNMPIIGNPYHCTPIFGICVIDDGGDFPFTDYSQPHDNAGFDSNGNLVLEFVNYDFENDEWLNGDVLVLNGDFTLSDKTASYLGGEPVTVKAGRYHLEYNSKTNSKTVVFDSN